MPPPDLKIAGGYPMWLIFRLFLEIGGGATGIVNTFAKCHTLSDISNVLMELDELQRAGILVLALMVVGGIVEIVRYLHQALKKPPPPLARRRGTKRPAPLSVHSGTRRKAKGPSA